MTELEQRFYQPLSLRIAIVRFEEWERVNAQAPLRARLEVLDELTRLYRLDRHPETVREEIRAGILGRNLARLAKIEPTRRVK